MTLTVTEAGFALADPAAYTVRAAATFRDAQANIRNTASAKKIDCVPKRNRTTEPVGGSMRSTIS